ncbi:M15 family metallopeptidase [Bacillus horti]
MPFIENLGFSNGGAQEPSNIEEDPVSENQGDPSNDAEETPEGEGATDTNQEVQVGTEEETSSTNGELDFTLESHYFNQIDTVDGQPTIQNPDNILVLVNKEFSLPADYRPEDLVIPNVAFSFSEDDEKRYLRQVAAEALEELFEAAEQEGHILYGVSGFRSYNRQTTIFNWQVQSKGEEEARRVSAFPGQSEHQTGLTIDISSESAQFGLTELFGQTTEGQWVAENAHKYGFIIRYPDGKEDITGYIYEPWHVRYVGEEIATLLYENDLTLEEYFDHVREI